MEVKGVLQIQVLFLVISVTCALPVAFRFPLREGEVTSPWGESQLHSEEDQGKSGGDDAVDVISLSFPKSSLRYPDVMEGEQEEEEPRIVLSFRNAIPEAHENEGHQPHLERFYKHAPYSTGSRGQMIVFPKEEYTPRNSPNQMGENAEDSLLTSRSGESNQTNEVLVDSEEVKKAIDSTDSLDEIVREIVNSEGDALKESADSDNGKPSVSEFSLYGGAGPNLKKPNDGCPEGYKKTRHGACQKPSGRLNRGR